MVGPVRGSYGQIHLEKVGPKGLAKEVYRMRKTAIKQAKFFPELVGQQKVILFDELAKDFLACSKMHKRSFSLDAQRMRRPLDAFGWRPAKALNAEEIEHFKVDLSAQRTPATVNRHLAGLPRNGVYIFAEEDGETPWDFTHTFATAAKKAGIPGLHLHDLRHTFASRRAMAGVDLLTIKELGGWKTLAMVERYAHLSPDHTR